uniref:HECT domain-containing protein n=1 Tax=Caenorhabditis japonica TaxID=281687 RepID=A0A8R1I7K6_CAEJA
MHIVSVFESYRAFIIEKRTAPTAISDLIGSHVTRIAVGACHTIAIVKGGVYPFGLNSSGQLGNGKTLTQSTPRRTDELDHVTSVFAGYQQTFFIRSVGTIEQNEIVGPSCPLKYPIKITKNILEEKLKTGEKLDVIALLESVFSSLNCINQSFLYSDERRFNVGHERSHGVDLDQVMDTFMLIDESYAKKQYVDLIVDSFLIALESWSSKIRGVEALRIFLILPWLSEFTENVSMNTLHKLHLPFTRALCSINQGFGSTLELWWSKLSIRHFRRIVNVFKTAVRVNVKAEKQPVDCQLYLHVLHRLFVINKHTHTIPLETFYIDEINNLVDIKLDYWAKVTRQDPVKYEQNCWTYYPFLLNGAAKGDCVFAEARLKQMITVRQAQFNAVFNPFEQEYQENLNLTVGRDTIVIDTMNQMASLSTNELQLPLKVKIRGEEADDAGGVRKEFFLIVMRKILQPEYGMFVENEESRLVWFSGLPAELCEQDQFHQLGRLVGLAVYNQVLVPFPFPLMLYKVFSKNWASPL